MTRVRESVKEDKRAQRTQRRRKQTAGEILDAALEVLLEGGIQSFKLAAVAEQLGLTTPALYYYFNSREVLLAELILREQLDCASVVHAAVEETTNGADAVEQLMRTVFARYRERLDLFDLAYRVSVTPDIQALVNPEALERVRPANDLFYGGAEKRLRADQRAGRFSRKRDARRFAFTAHTAVLGVLGMKAMTEAVSDPLVHSDQDLIDDICKTFRATASGGGSQ